MLYFSHVLFELTINLTRPRYMRYINIYKMNYAYYLYINIKYT